ncbi:MAG: hypothetical protein DRR00_32735 [Candidatus Parabeggiatoa sp. nov. 3]|nr:MAG: hypothetical protein DRR00_32735 [Gammaproteobacteria bacterium]RKZ54802.1 MAG: hypothetical protein DRQ99_30905 [Gammaproteobacteria bacterium]
MTRIGQVYQQTDPLARITKTEYDAQGRIIAELAPNEFYAI